MSLSFARQVREGFDPQRAFEDSARDVLRELDWPSAGDYADLVTGRVPKLTSRRFRQVVP